MASIKIVDRRQAPAGFADSAKYIVSALIKLGADDESVKLTRYQKPKNDQEQGKVWSVGSYAGGDLRLTEIVYHERSKENGDGMSRWVQINNMELPRDVQNKLIDAIVANSSGVPQQNDRGQPQGQYDGEGDPFDNGVPARRHQNTGGNGGW